MTITYNTGIPNSPNDPSDDQPLMQTNTNSIATFVAIDHVGFGAAATNGYHNKSTYAKQAADPAAVAAATPLYSKLVSYAGGNNDLEIFMRKASDDSNNPSSVIQLTNTRFGPATSVNGTISYLPGGFILIAYIDSSAHVDGAVISFLNGTFTFPTACLGVSATPIKTSACQFSASAISTTGFTIHVNASPLSGISYIAIGY